MTKTQLFWIWHETICFPTNGQEILTGFEPSKRSKTLKKLPHCPYFDTQEAVFAELNFGGENGGQIGKSYLSWKLDRHTFPTSILGANFDTGKAFKSGSKQALRIENQARRIEEIWTSLTRNALFFAYLLPV